MTLTQISSRGVEDALRWSLGAGGSNYYTFTGPGLTGTVNNPTIYLSRGHTYIFENNNSANAHPFQIQSTSGQGGTAYNTGVTNNGGGGGSEIKITVPHGAPDILYYQCTAHANMGGTIYITGAVADGTITTAKLATDSVTATKIVDGNVSTAKIAASAITSGRLADNAVITAKIAADAITGAKIADDAVAGEHIADNSISTAHIQTGAVTTTDLADNAVTADKIATDAITTAKIADGAINTDRIAGSAVTGTRIADGAVTNSKIANNAINSAKIENNVIVNADINSSAAIAGTKIDPNFGSQNIVTTGDLECDGEFKPHWFGHQSQCVDITHNTHNYWKIAEVTGSGSEGGQIVFFGTNSYSSNNSNNTAGRTTLVLRHTTDNKLDGIFWSESGSNSAVTDIRWKYTGSNNVYEIWVRKGAYNNVVPHITGSFDHVQTFGSSTGTDVAPSSSTGFEPRYQVQVNNSNNFSVESGDIIMQNKRVFSASGYSNMNVTYSHDAVCANDSGNGQWFWVVCGHTHYNHSYGTERIAACHARGTSINTIHNVLSNTSTLGGSWSFSKPNTTTFRVTHNAGTYAYPGRYTVTVYSST